MEMMIQMAYSGSNESVVASQTRGRLQHTAGQIQAISLTTTPVMVDLRGAGRVQIRISGDDVRIAYSILEVNSGEYFTMADGTNAIYDPPNLMGDSVYIRADTGTATISIWKQGVNY